MLRISFRPMTARGRLALAVSSAFLFALPSAALAQADSNLTDLREQIRLLREQYERRIDALERRIADAERAATHARSDAAAAAASVGEALDASRNASETASRAVAQAGSSSASAFNPAISLILNGSYGNLSGDPDRYRIDGFVPTHGEVAPPGRGLSLGESELAISASIDPYFRGALNVALGADDGIAVEEATLQTIGLPAGLSVKAGRFFSAIGYLNEVHAHAWDFADAPLANKVFLGNRFADDGLQVKWVAPTDTYLDFGIEFGRGRGFPGGPEGGRSKNGFGSGNLFAHAGGDIGAGASWKLGLSYLRTAPQDRAFDDVDSTGTDVSNSFSGESRLLALGGVLKWAPNGNATSTSFKVQGEYFRRRESGSLTYDTAAASLGTLSGPYSSRQSGWYLQGIYQFMPRWRVGYRHDRLDAGHTRIGLVDSGVLSGPDFPILAAYSPARSTLMVDWSGSEFSRLRLQLARERARAGFVDNQLFLQYIVSLGAHGAHLF